MEQLSDKKLFTEFPPVSTTQWEEKIKEDLKECKYQKKLIWNTPEGFSVKPFYRVEDMKNTAYLQTCPGEFPFVRGGSDQNNNWEIRQDVLVANIDQTNQYLLQILESGVTSPGLKFSGELVDSKERLAQLLHGVHIDCITLNLLADKHSPRIFSYLQQIVGDTNLITPELKGSFDFDPIGNLTANGNFYKSEEEDFQNLKNFIGNAVDHLPLYRLITVNGLIFSNAGASIVQELAFSLSAGNEYLSKLTDEGLAIEDIAGRMQFTFGTGPNYFMEIAKFRAARFLWSKIVEAYNPKDKKIAKMFIHAVTTEWNKTVFDPYVNILRTTTETMSAALGGADSIEVIPFDSAYAAATGFSSRIARNTQIILKEEAYFDKVADIAAGSYYIENLTDSIVSHAWNLFLDIEKKGGYIKAFKEGIIQEMIAVSAGKKMKNIAAGKEVLLGTNQYPHYNESMCDKINQQKYNPHNNEPGKRVAKQLNPLRGSEEFEILRLQTEKAAKRPIVFMLTIGNSSMRKARAAFSCSFFACAGYEVVDNTGFQSVDKGVTAAFDAKADIIVLCSSDDEYALYAPEAKNLIDDKVILVIAGEPACKPDLENRDIKNFISLRSDMVETLTYYHNLLGIK